MQLLNNLLDDIKFNTNKETARYGKYIWGRDFVRKLYPTNIFNFQCISAEWLANFEKNAFKILHSAYILLS